MTKVRSILISLFCLLLAQSSFAYSPKREFRGAWIQAVNGQFVGMGRDKMQAVLKEQLDLLQRAGINAIMFQVRPEADALYASKYEPWSRFLTGTQGTPPNPYWDPLQWMIEQAHKRGMELHAWINPYRAKTKTTTALATTHPYMLHPERFFHYDGQIIFDPAFPENRQYICTIVRDIIDRYDVDGIHMDDYFYPYPVSGVAIPDDASYARYPSGIQNRGDWRRNNVNILIKNIHDCIRSSKKPWVKFGVSPFGIYRNRTSDPNGSNTSGLENYDGLYADVLAWIQNGWVDYNIPQLYWEIGNKAADYATLVQWWGEHSGDRPFFVGQDVERTVKYQDLNNPQVHQMTAKYQLQRQYAQGSCQWYAKAVCDNPGAYRDQLEHNYHRYPALQPLMPFIYKSQPRRPRRVKVVYTSDGPVLFWSAPFAKSEKTEAVSYVVYRFEKGEDINLDDASKIVKVTREKNMPLKYDGGKKSYTYVVTSLDHLQNESKPAKRKVKL